MPGGLRRNRRGLSLQSEEGGRNCQEYKAGAAGRDGRISPHPPRSQAQVPAHLGTSGSGRARAGDRCQCPGGSVAAGWGSWGTSKDLLSGCSPGGRLGGGGSSLSNLPRSPSPAQPGEAGAGGGGRVGMGRPRPAGPVEPGAPAVWGGRHLEKAGSSGAGIAVGGGMSQRLQTHKIPLSHWCPETRMLGVGAPAGEPGTWGEPPGPAPGPQIDSPGLALPRQAGRQVLDGLETELEREGKGWGGGGWVYRCRVRGDRWRWGGIGVTEGRMGCWVRGKEDGAAPGGTEFLGGLGMEWGD